MGEWRSGGHRPGLILVIGEQDLSRLGHVWMQGRLLVGDLIMCLRRSGDCFWQYCLVGHRHPLDPFCSPECYGRGYRLMPFTEFGAYVLGTPYVYQPSEREFHLLMAGERIELSAEQSECRD